MTPWTQRLVPAVWFLLACALGALAPTAELVLRFGAAAVGSIMALLLVALWGPRTRPATTWRWSVLFIAGILAALLSSGWVASGLAAAGVTFYVRHDHSAGPGAILLLGTFALLRQPTWTAAGQTEAWWLASAMSSLVVAAVLERERLAAQVGTPTRPTGSIARVAWIPAWSLGFLWLHEFLPLAAWIRATGLDVSQTSGRIALVAILLLATAAAGLFLRDRKARRRTE